MSPRATALFCSLLAAALFSELVLAPGAGAEEAKEPGAAPKALQAKDKVLAEQIGRDLLSGDERVRAKAVRRLSKRLDEGFDTELFLHAMSQAQEAWANEHARMLEVWLAEAVDGVGEARLRAIRLLTALGSHAVRRLAEELKHERHHGKGRDRSREGETPAVGEELPPHAEAANKVAYKTELAAGIPYRYELGDLIKDGWRRFDLRSMLLREGDASRVVRHDTGYIVTAPARGHDRLRSYLMVLRSGQTSASSDKSKPGSQWAGGSTTGTPPSGREKQKPASAAQPTPQEAAERNAAQPNADASPQSPRTPRQRATSLLERPTELVELKQEQPPLPEPVVRPQWRIEPMILHLPSSKALGARLAAESDSYQERKVPFEHGRALTGTLADVKHWAGISSRMAEAHADLNVSGNVLLAPGRSTRLFSGKTVRYSKNVRRLKGGAWGIVEGTIHDGIELEVAIVRQANGLRVDVVAQRTDVGTPLPVVSVRPSPGAVAVELERPEWSTTRLATSFVLPGEAGGAFLPLDGLGEGPDEEVVLLLAVAPHTNRPAVRKSRVILPSNRK